MISGFHLCLVVIGRAQDTAELVQTTFANLWFASYEYHYDYGSFLRDFNDYDYDEVGDRRNGLFLHEFNAYDYDEVGDRKNGRTIHTIAKSSSSANCFPRSIVPSRWLENPEDLDTGDPEVHDLGKELIETDMHFFMQGRRDGLSDVMSFLANHNRCASIKRSSWLTDTSEGDTSRIQLVASHSHRNNALSAGVLRKALVGKQIAFVGDSMARQLFATLIGMLRGDTIFFDDGYHDSATYVMSSTGDCLHIVNLSEDEQCDQPHGSGTIDFVWSPLERVWGPLDLPGAQRIVSEKHLDALIIMSGLWVDDYNERAESESVLFDPIVQPPTDMTLRKLELPKSVEVFTLSNPSRPNMNNALRSAAEQRPNWHFIDLFESVPNEEANAGDQHHYMCQVLHYDNHMRLRALRGVGVDLRFDCSNEPNKAAIKAIMLMLAPPRYSAGSSCRRRDHKACRTTGQGIDEDQCQKIFESSRFAGQSGKTQLFHTARLAQSEEMHLALYEHPLRSAYPASWWSNLDADAEDDGYSLLWGSVNPEISRWFEEDQNATQLPNRREIQESLWQKVREVLDAGQCRSPADFWACAFIMHHGYTVEQYKMANVLGLTAVELCSKTTVPSLLCATTGEYKPEDTVWWSFAAMRDRLLVAEGLPQLFGTQLEGVEGEYGNDIVEMTKGRCKWFKTGIDRRVTDEMRCEWGTPVLSRLNLCAEEREYE